MPINAEVRELLDSFSRCVPYIEPVAPDERARLLPSRKRRGKIWTPETTYLSDEKTETIWKWLQAEDREKQNEKDKSVGTWMYELP